MDQYNSLALLSQYLDSLTNDKELDKSHLKDLKSDQKTILKEMRNIKKVLDN